MTSSMDERSEDRGVGPGWLQFVDKRATVNIREGSLLVPSGSDLAAAASRVAEILTELLAPSEGRARTPLTISVLGTSELSTLDGESPTPASSSDHVVIEVDERQPAISLPEPLVRAQIERWYGSAAARAPIVVGGIAAYVSARLHDPKDVRRAHDEVREALKAGQDISVFHFGLDPSLRPDHRTVAQSFVAFLRDVYGGPTLGRYLAAYDPDRQDSAAMAAYFQPLGALEESWIESIRHETHGGTAFRALFRQLIPLISPHRTRALELLILMVLGVGLTIAMPLTIMHIVDHILPHAHGHYDDLFLYVGLLLILFILNGGIGARRTFVQHWLNEQVMLTLHHRVYSHLQRLSHNYYSRTTTSNMMTVLTEDLREIRAAIAMVAGSGLYQALLALSTAVTVLILDPLLGLMVLIIVPVFAAGYVALRSRWQHVAHGLQRLLGEADHLAHENLSAHGEIKAFGLQEHVISTYKQRHHDMFGRQLQLVNISALFESTLHIASGIGYVVVFGFGGYQVIAEKGVTLGTLFAFAHLLPLFYEPIERLADLGHTVEGAAGAFDRLDEVLEEPVMIADKPNPISIPPLASEIRLEHVTFGYGVGRPVLKDLSLTIPAGSDVAIVGPSGCGKSTVVNLLMRFWDPDEGRVLFDGTDIRDTSLESLRSQIGIVFPETFTFNTSVRENIAIGHPEATDAEIELAARAAQFDQFVKTLPAGYNTVLGERGIRMSSGQRQRLAIARALLRDPQVLILDEATSALDPQTESEFLETLATVGHGRTTISIRHRLAAVATADLIFVLDQGQLVEQGHHAELVKAGGLYQQLYEEQMHYLHGGGVLRVGVDVDRLRAIPLFSDLAEGALEAVAERFMLERYAPGEEVVRQGDRGDKLYMISRGQLDVLVDEGERRRKVNSLWRGDYFGEMALVTKEPRNATIRTVTPTQFYSLAAADFETLMDRVPEVREAVIRTVEGRRIALAGNRESDSPLPNG